MVINNELKQQLLKSADAHQLQVMALNQGMSNLRHEGAILVLEGITTTEEVLRVTRGCEL